MFPYSKNFAAPLDSDSGPSCCRWRLLLAYSFPTRTVLARRRRPNRSSPRKEQAAHENLPGDPGGYSPPPRRPSFGRTQREFLLYKCSSTAHHLLQSQDRSSASGCPSAECRPPPIAFDIRIRAGAVPHCLRTATQVENSRGLGVNG